MALTNKLTAIADAIRTKTGKTDTMTLDQMVTEIDGITTGGSTEEWIGDGNTHIWVTLAEGRTSPMLGVCPKGTVTVDWGDGTAPNVLTGTSTSTVKWTPTHEYAKPGDYVITLTVDGEMGLKGSYNQKEQSAILRYSSSGDTRNYAYHSAVNKIEVCDGVIINDYAFQNLSNMKAIRLPDYITGTFSRSGFSVFASCRKLESVDLPDGLLKIETSAFYYSGVRFIRIPDGVTSIGAQAFYNSCLQSIYIPDSVESIGSDAFKECSRLTAIKIPSKVTNLGTYLFNCCYALRYCDFTEHTSVPTLADTNAFTSIPADCEIRVPAALYDEWIAATNWVTYAANIVAV